MKTISATVIKYTIGLILLTVFTFHQAFSVVPKPEIGKVVPDYVFDNVNHYSKKSLSISDFRGKWLFLDFWSNACAGCVKSFEEINDLQKQFGDRSSWVLVGVNSLLLQKDIDASERLYEKLATRHQYDLITVYDSVLYNDWDVPFVPYVLVIDPDGILRYFTTSDSFSSERIRQLLDGKAVEFYNGTHDRGATVSPGMWIENGKPIYASLVTGWSKEPQKMFSIDDFITWKSKSSGLQIIRSSLDYLYNNAYFGQYYFKNTFDSIYGHIYPYPIHEMKDTSRFVENWGLGIGMYNYYLFLPPEKMTKEALMAQMQVDLKRSFGYTAMVETRVMPVWKLVAEPSTAKLIKAKGDVTYNSTFERAYVAGFWVKNTPFKDFYWTLTSYLAVDEKDVFINATGFTGLVDITVDGELTNFNDIQKALKKYHMKFVRSEASMQVLVIRD